MINEKSIPNAKEVHFSIFHESPFSFFEAHRHFPLFHDAFARLNGFQKLKLVHFLFRTQTWTWTVRKIPDQNRRKTYENKGNKSHQTTTNYAQRATIIHFEINRDMLSFISNKIVILDFYMISNGSFYMSIIIIRSALSNHCSLYCSEDPIGLTNFLNVFN